MGKLATPIGPALLTGLLISCLIAGPASALELAMGGTFYVTVLEGECPQPIDLWGVGPGRSPLFLGHYQGRVNKRPPIFMGSYKAGQELYIWHETNEPGTGERRSQDIKSAEAYKVSIDPRGGFLIELKVRIGQTEPALKMWVYPARPPVSLTPGAGGKQQVTGTVGSVVVNPTPVSAISGDRVAASVATNPVPVSINGGPPRHADTWGGWQWPALQAAVAMLLFMSYRRSRQIAMAAGGVGQVSIGEVDVQSFGRPEDGVAHAFASAGSASATAPLAGSAPHGSVPVASRPRASPAPAPASVPAPAAAVAVGAEHDDIEWANQPAAVAREIDPEVTVAAHTIAAPPPSVSPSAATSPARAHYHACAPEGWSPLPSDSATSAPTTRALPPPSLPDRGATPIHQPTHPAARRASRPPAAAESTTGTMGERSGDSTTGTMGERSGDPTEGLLEALGRRRPMGLPLAFVTPRSGAKTAPVSTSPAHSGAVGAVTRALASAFHDLELVHADEELVVLSGLDLILRRRVSIHALSPALSREEKLAAQFVREGQEFAALTHRGLLRIHRVVAEPIPYLVAEPLPGLPLSAALTSGEPMPLHEVLAAGAHLTDALDYLHQRGMIHGDLRPSRVAGGFHHELRLCPPVFPQIAVEALASLGLTAAERRAYRPPEVTAGGTADYRGDLHAVGLVLHHMLTGALPSHTSDDDDSTESFRYRASVPDTLSTLVRRCLQGDPSRRYQDSGITRQMLESMIREHAARERVVLACLPGLARVVRTALKPLVRLLRGAHTISAEQLAREVVTPVWRDTVRTRLLGADGGLVAIGVLIERSHGLRRWAQEASLLAILERLGRMAIELAGLATLIESGGPRHPSVADRARTELIRLGEDIAAFEAAVQDEITARLVDFAGVTKDAIAVGTFATLSVDAQGVPAALRGLFAEPATVRLQLVTAISTALAAARAAGAGKCTVHGAYDEGYKRVVITISDDGRGIPAPVVRPPLAIVPRLTRPVVPGERATARDLEHTFEAVERLGGRVMITNRSMAPGVELRIELPSNLC